MKNPTKLQNQHVEQDYHQTGGLAKKISNSQKVLESKTQDSPQNFSLITGSQKPAQIQEKLTGPELGEIGVEIRSFGKNKDLSSQEINQKMLESFPSSARYLAKFANLKERGSFFSSRARYIRRILEKQEINIPLEDINTVKKIVATRMRGAPKDFILYHLTKFAVKTRCPKEDDYTKKIRFKVFISELSAYPRDVIAECLEEYAKENSFFPSWAELFERLEEKIESIRWLEISLEKLIDQYEEKKSQGC